jgi:hypothetical protein
MKIAHAKWIFFISKVTSSQNAWKKGKHQQKVTRTNLNYEHHNSKDDFHNLRQKVNTDGTELKLPINL